MEAIHFSDSNSFKPKLMILVKPISLNEYHSFKRKLFHLSEEDHSIYFTRSYCFLCEDHSF